MGKRIAVVGAGAIGGYVGGHLALNGHDVTLIDPWPEHVEAIRTRGLELSGMTPEEQCVAHPRALHVTEAQGLAKEKPIDIAFVAVKSYDTEWATMLVAQYLAPGGYVVALQNCMNEERIARIVGWGKTVGVIPARLSAELYEAGRVRRTAMKGGTHAVFRAGEVHGRVTARIEELGAMFAAIDTVDVTDNLWGERWSKLCVNAMRNGIGASTGLSGNEFDRHEAIRRFSIRVGSEAVRVGQAQGYKLVHIANLDPDRLAAAGTGDRAALEEIEAVILAGSNSAGRSDLQRPSMGQDMRKGRRTEIDFINGVVAGHGAEIGIATPANLALIEAVKRVERGEVPARPENLAGL